MKSKIDKKPNAEKNPHIIAIDPDINKCGVCEMNQDGEIIKLYTLKPIALFKFLGTLDGVTIAVEDVEQVRAIYTKNQRQNQAIANRIAQNVGMVKAAGRLIIDAAEENNLTVIKAPAGVGRQVKNNAKLFNEIFNWSGRSNADTRDAAAIARYALNKINN